MSSPSTSLEKFTPSTKPFAGDLGTLCHLSPRKRVYDLILTFYELCQQRDGFHLHIAGGADQYNEDYNEALHHIVSELQLQDKVTFYGNVKEAWDWYHKIDIFISNSFSEGLQVAPMEAMASGCYCLIHRWSGAEEMVPAENLFFTGTELRTSILEYAELPAAQQQALQVRMRELACEKFDINQTKQQIANVIDEVAAAVGNAPGHR